VPVGPPNQTAARLLFFQLNLLVVVRAKMALQQDQVDQAAEENEMEDLAALVTRHQLARRKDLTADLMLVLLAGKAAAAAAARVALA
jgi:hypothetical protein